MLLAKKLVIIFKFKIQLLYILFILQMLLHNHELKTKRNSTQNNYVKVGNIFQELF